VSKTREDQPFLWRVFFYTNESDILIWKIKAKINVGTSFRNIKSSMRIEKMKILENARGLQRDFLSGDVVAGGWGK